MKKIFSLLLALALLLAAVPTVFAAGSAGWNGPDVVRAGDTITLTFYAGGGIYGGSGAISYDPDVLTLVGYTQTIGGSWVLEWGGDSFIFYDNAMSSPITGSSSIFQATFVVNANAPVGAQIKVSATGSQGAIEMMVGVDGEGVVTGVSIVKHSETSGIGTKVTGNVDGVLDQFKGMSGAGTLVVGTNVDAISGATVSSKGVTSGVNAALAAVEALG